MVIRELVWFGPSIPVEAVKACALVGLKTTWAMTRCASSDYIGSGDKISQGGVGLPHGPGQGE